MSRFPTMAGKKLSMGQKNFSIGDAKSVFERFAGRNGYDETRLFLASFLAFQELDDTKRRRMFAQADAWLQSGFAANAEGVATVSSTAAEQQRPAESTTSRPASRRAS